MITRADAFVIGGFIGATVASCVTYWYSTTYTRIIKGVRSNLQFLADYNDLIPRERRSLEDLREQRKLIVYDDILRAYQWGELASRHLWKQQRIRVHATLLAAQCIICERMLGRNGADALLAFPKIKREHMDLDKIKIVLPKIADEPQS
jgi:hypothetical protein